MITAVILAAGLSSRMGRFKPLLPYGSRTVIAQVISVLAGVQIEPILVVTGFNRQALESEVRAAGAQAVHNPLFQDGEMLSSIQAGLRAASPAAEAALIALGDQPAIEAEVVVALVQAFRHQKGGVIIPSYNMKRGHPILISREYWRGILELNHDQTMRDFLQRKEIIHHVNVRHESILRDMDTIADYERELVFLKESIADYEPFKEI